MTESLSNKLYELLGILDSVEKRLLEEFPDYHLIVVPYVSERPSNYDADIRAITEYELKYFSNIEQNRYLLDSEKDVIFDKYHYMQKAVYTKGSIASMDGLHFGTVAYDFVGFDMNEFSEAAKPSIGDGSHDMIFAILHEIGHTIHSKYYGAYDKSRFNIAQTEVFADVFAADYMKYELGIENAYALISKFRADDSHKFYPFHEHAAQLERLMHINADLSFCDAIEKALDYIEYSAALKISTADHDATVNCVNGFNMAVTALQKKPIAHDAITIKSNRVVSYAACPH